jgi:hypothetical protein
VDAEAAGSDLGHNRKLAHDPSSLMLRYRR